MTTGDLARDRRYLIHTDAGQVEAAMALTGEVYSVLSLESAKNGKAAEIAGRPVVIWPDKDTLSLARLYARELAEFGEVKLIDVSQGFMPSPTEMLQNQWDYKQFVEWVTGKAEHSVNLLEIVSVNAPSPVPPAESGSPLDSAETSLPDEGAPFEEIPVEAYSDAQEPLSAMEAWLPYNQPGNVSEWPEPLDLSRALYAGQKLPIGLIPAALQQITEDCARRTGIDAAPFFFGFLGAVSGLANDFIRCQPKQLDQTWTVRPVVWPVAIGGPSSGKSPGLEEGMRWVQKKDTEAVLENIKKKKDYDFLMQQYADDCTAARKNKGPRPADPEPPVLREYWVQRGTTEGVTRVLEHSDKVVWYMDEFSGIVSGWDAYKSGKGSGDREFVLQLWNGGPGKNTLAGKTVVMRNASAVLCGGSTPSAMLKCAGGKLQNDGFLQRTLLCMVPDMVQGTDEPADMHAIREYDRMLENVLAMPGGVTVKLSSDAGLIYAEFCNRVMQRIKNEDSEALASHLGKWAGLAPRMMLLYHIIERAAAGQWVSDSDTISPGIASQVCRLLLEWQLSHIQQFWHEVMADKVGRSFSKTISRYILANPQKATLNFRDDISRPHWREFDNLKPWEIKEAINSLISAAWIQPTSTKNNSYGVAPTYDVNPKLAEMFQEQREQEILVRNEKRAELQARRGKGED